ncbi:hypothetical protein BH09VER1_BH09VER1_52460 [soil metagenome]
MRIAVTGFVSGQAGSVASANALLLRGLLDHGCEIKFFSKASFVDPREAVGPHPHFEFKDVDNQLADSFRARVERIPFLGRLAGLLDATTYNLLLVRKFNEANRREKFDLCLWLGDYANGTVKGIPTVSFAQGPPGTDARSIIERFPEIARFIGPSAARKWRIMARLRLSRFGLPAFRHSNCIIVGSQQSRQTLRLRYGIPEREIRLLPYPIDLEMFNLPATPPAASPTLRVLWLGRIIPRKRLDLFLDGAAEAIRRGLDLKVSIVGGVGFVPGYEKLIESFPFPDRLRWQRSLPREQVPALLHEHDVLSQPSEEENFGSSVAEAQACGLPVIIGATNGNADYLCSRDIHLADYSVKTYADALERMARRKQDGKLGHPADSRLLAEKYFAIETLTRKLVEILRAVSAKR